MVHNMPEIMPDLTVDSPGGRTDLRVRHDLAVPPDPELAWDSRPGRKAGAGTRYNRKWRGRLNRSWSLIKGTMSRGFLILEHNMYIR